MSFFPGTFRPIFSLRSLTIDKKYIVEDGEGEEFHTTVTVFEPDVVRDGMPFDYAEHLLSKSTNRELDITKESPESETDSGEILATDSETELSADMLSQNNSSVKMNFSLSDSDYLSTVESGDMLKAQKMVDEAANRNGYTVDAYHGTAADFTVFDMDRSSELGQHFGTKEQAEDRVRVAVENDNYRLQNWNDDAEEL